MEFMGALGWSDLCTFALFGMLFLFFAEIFRITFPTSNIPPGRKPFPFVGNVPQIIKDPMKFINEMKNYGEISSVYLGRKPSISLNTIGVAREALLQNGSDFLGRPLIPVLDWVIHGKGIVMANGDSWKQQRKFALHTLRSFGFGKKSLEERVSEEAKCLAEELEKQGEKPCDPQFWLMNATSNIICSIVFGNRFDYDNERFCHLLDIVNKNIIMTGSVIGQIFNLVPIIKYLPGPQQQIQRNAKEFTAFISEAVKEHHTTLDRENPRDFIDAYIMEIEKQNSNPESSFCEENMVFSVADLFLAGTDTTSTTLRWGLMFMLDHPDIQERCHQEIADVIGYERCPSMEDRANMHYVLATLHEIQRFANITPLGVMRGVTTDTQLRGFRLAKGTQVFVNMTAIFTNKDHWKFPNEFNPGNFLDDEGKFLKHEFFVPFSLGPRLCLGEQLARMELFIFFTSLLQRLRFTHPPGVTSSHNDGIFGLIRSPKPFKLVCQKREF
ncbi:cytochrome P450 2B4-like [Paramormyrops kingsleyae]|uniref:cytochrome P450 2B4-like n=1 Tax=Paramormyrops kingsleyae TaxID=1676925 RepID=UPI003B97BC4B